MRFVANHPEAACYGKSIAGANFINGRWVEAAGGGFERRNPANRLDLIGSFPLSGREEVREAARAARKAFEKWSATPAPVRAEVIGRFGDLIAKHKGDLSRLLTREIGKTPREAGGDVQEAVDTARFFQSEGRRLYGQTVPSEMRRKELFTYRRPLGVCGMITAGNFPVAVPSWKIIPALICGNTVVWKASDDAPGCASLFMQLLAEAGAPAGVVNLVHGGGGNGAGQYLVELVHEGLIDKISFTGSTAVGRWIGAECGRALQIPSLELGGKNPMIVTPSANLDQALEGALWAAFGTAGQRCTSLGNLILHEDIAGDFTRRFAERAGQIRIGDPSLHGDVLYGPMINERFMQGFLEHLQWGREEGAIPLMHEGRITRENACRLFEGDAAAGLYVWPAVWSGVTIQMRLAQTEIFGPTVNIIKARDFDEAMAFANGTPYGLSSAIYTNDPVEMHRFRTEIQAGMSSINNSTTGAEAHLPFGGVKGSGNGTRESGVWVIDAYSRWQAVNADYSGGLQLAQIDTETVEASAPPVDFSALWIP
ncbi:MAG: Aldehyde dehydrogenase, thermostable [Myxococcota bacterium]|nr:Aldehyde dehydrogenase, thermostable [Myxococcota bacterium]